MLCGLTLAHFVELPTPVWVGGDELSGDRRPILLALALVSLRGTDCVLIAGVVVVWAVALRFTWRRRLFERWLGVDIRQVPLGEIRNE